jgi:hypothetical protein
MMFAIGLKANRERSRTPTVISDKASCACLQQFVRELRRMFATGEDVVDVSLVACWPGRSYRVNFM